MIIDSSSGVVYISNVVKCVLLGGSRRCVGSTSGIGRVDIKEIGEGDTADSRGDTRSLASAIDGRRRGICPIRCRFTESSTKMIFGMM